MTERQYTILVNAVTIAKMEQVKTVKQLVGRLVQLSACTEQEALGALTKWADFTRRVQ